MRHAERRSLLIQLLSIYLLFVFVVIITEAGFNLVVDQQLRNGVQQSDQALAQEIALETNLQLLDDANSLINLGGLVKQAGSPEAIQQIFRTYQMARSDVDYVYWLDPVGEMRIAWPLTDQVNIGAEFSPPDVVQRARSAAGPVFEVGIAVETTFNAGIILADPVRDTNGHLIGIIAANLSLVELSEPLTTVVNAQLQKNRHLSISIIDNRGELIATPNHQRILQTVLDELPGAEAALQGQTTSLVGRGSGGQDWLFSAVPIPEFRWAVIVQEPANEALAVVTQFHDWLFTTAALFGIGGLIFWVVLHTRVIRPLHTLAIQHQALPASEQAISVHTALLARRHDEVGGLARSLVRLERDGLEQLGELRTLLETSNAVVRSFDTYAVVGTIIREARRLVDVQAAAVLVPDNQGILRVLVSDGHSAQFDHLLTVNPDNIDATPVLALRDKQPVQKLLRAGNGSVSYEEGFRSVLAIPIISRHAGGVVLLVHRTELQSFDEKEIDLLLTFANYATLAWEHAVLYERSDERLREVAQENERLYQQAAEDKQKLEAIMGSMSDGLVLTSIDGCVLYANMGASALMDTVGEALVGRSIGNLYEALRSRATHPDEFARTLEQIQAGVITEAVIEIRSNEQRRALHLRIFDVEDDARQSIGRGLLLRDVTREREIDEFKTALLAAVGHELRTPLAAIKGHASTLLQPDVIWPLADQRHFLRTISQEADRLATLVSNLLDLSRQEAGLLLLNRQPTQMHDLVADVLQRLPHPSIAVTSAIPADAPLVEIARARVEVVLHNLVTNALTYGATAVTITAEQRAETLVVAVTDNGPGVASDELPHLFDRFYCTQHGRHQHSGGTGLGLTICKAFIEAHGCAIWAEQTGQGLTGQGLTISFTLPLCAPALIGEVAMPGIATANGHDRRSDGSGLARDGSAIPILRRGAGSASPPSATEEDL